MIKTSTGNDARRMKFPVMTELGRRLETAAKELREVEAETVLRELGAYVGQALQAYVPAKR